MHHKAVYDCMSLFVLQCISSGCWGTRLAIPRRTYLPNRKVTNSLRTEMKATIRFPRLAHIFCIVSSRTVQLPIPRNTPLVPALDQRAAMRNQTSRNQEFWELQHLSVLEARVHLSEDATGAAKLNLLGLWPVSACQVTGE